MIKALDASTKIPSYHSRTVLGADSRNPYNDPTLPYYNPNLGGKNNDSKQYIRKPIQHYDDEHASGTDLTNPYANGADAWNNKGLEFYDLQRFEEAISYHDKAIEINPKDVDAWNNKGLALLALRRYKEAIECHDKAIEINPKDANAWYYKGLNFYDSGRFEEAEECYKKAKELGYNG